MSRDRRRDVFSALRQVDSQFHYGRPCRLVDPDSVWPNSREAIERQMQHLSPEIRRKLTRDNAAALYGLS